MHKNRPIRICLTNEQGKKITLASGKDAFMRLDGPRFGPREHIVLGLGPLIHEQGFNASLPHAEFLNTGCKVFYLECPNFIQALAKQGVVQAVPEHWEKISATQLMELIAGRAIWWYKQNIHLFADFWSPILGQVQAKLLGSQQNAQAVTSVYVAGNKGQLLHQEICKAFADVGYAVHEGKDLRNVLMLEQLSLFFSVNLRGLDSDGVDFSLLQALNIPVAIWFVDNPWHILSALRLPWWKQAKLFVTDASFIPDLKKHGAKHVYHLPLAAAQHMWQPEKSVDTLNIRQAIQAVQSVECIFVGRAQFPEHASFFAAAKIEQSIVDEAFNRLEEGKQVDFHWWQERLEIETWPGYDVRKIGLGAEKCACAQRVLWLRALLALQPIIFGDSVSWQKFLPEAKPHIFYANLDYYTELAAIYHVAPCVLNVTSLLLPAGLTQRHFDVWAAGGFLLTNYTDGLNIFPKHLTKDICVNQPNDIVKILKGLNSTSRKEISLAWQDHIKAKHSYKERVSFVLQCIADV